MRTNLFRFIGASSPFPMVTRLGINKFDGAGTEFTAKNSLKNAPKALFCPISTFQPIIGQDINLINYLVVDSFGFQMPTSCVNHYLIVYSWVALCLFHKESSSKTFHIKMICMKVNLWRKYFFVLNGFAWSLVLMPGTSQLGKGLFSLTLRVLIVCDDW